MTLETFHARCLQAKCMNHHTGMASEASEIEEQSVWGRQGQVGGSHADHHMAEGYDGS